MVCAVMDAVMWLSFVANCPAKQSMLCGEVGPGSLQERMQSHKGQKLHRSCMTPIAHLGIPTGSCRSLPRGGTHSRNWQGQGSCLGQGYGPRQHHGRHTLRHLWLSYNCRLVSRCLLGCILSCSCSCVGLWASRLTINSCQIRLYACTQVLPGLRCAGCSRGVNCQM